MYAKLRTVVDPNLVFADRQEAGRVLSQRLAAYSQSKAVVFALPRGGVPVAFEVARQLSLALQIIIVRKIGAPYNPELGVGALSEKRTTYLNYHLMDQLGLSLKNLKHIIRQERQEMQRRRQIYRRGRYLSLVKNKIVIIVDDGLATGATMLAAVYALKQLQPVKVICAVPVCPADTVGKISPYVDELICLHKPSVMSAIGFFYRDFHQITDHEVIRLLQKASAFPKKDKQTDL